MAQPDCPTCGGTGWKIVERNAVNAQPLASPDSARSGAASGEPKMVWAVPCECTLGDRTDRLLARARVPERYRHCDFENFETDNDIENATREQIESWNRSLSQAKLVVQRFSQEFSPVREVQAEQGMLLMGRCGAGKTHLAVAALKSIVLRGHSGLFYDYRELLKQIQDSYNAESQSTELDVLEPVLTTDVLVLDDLGSSKPSLWALETVGHILNVRYNDKRVTILTTNYLDTDPAAAPNGATRATGMRAPAIDDTLTERVGARIRSRLYEMCRMVEMAGPDYRKEIRNVSRGRVS